jgi:hypothetical protein
MLDATAAATGHATLTGQAPAGARLTVRRSFQTPTSPVWRNDGGTDVGAPIVFADHLRSSLLARGGAFSWALNPSTRPLVAGRYARAATGPPQPPAPLVNPPGIPAEDRTGALAGENVAFTIAAPPAADNEWATVRIRWPSAAADWDLAVLDAQDRVVGASLATSSTTEEVRLFQPPPGRYTAVIVNYDGGAAAADWAGEVTFAGPGAATAGIKERWTLTCRRADGTSAPPLAVTVDRGATADVGDACAPPTARKAQRRAVASPRTPR